MKLRNLIISSFAVLAAMVACQPEGEEVGGLNIDLDKTELSFPVAGDDQTVSLTATQEWFTEVTYSEGATDWIRIDPETGAASAKPQTITISALSNTGGYDRTAQVKFSIGMRSKYVEVMQTGDKGSTDALVVYFNDFDKEVATQTYGTDNKYWPYLDQFPDGWKNQTGTGVANIDYSYASMSCRDNSNSDGKYSDYSGSGKNNLLFGNANYFAVTNITLGTEKNYTLSFGTTRYAGDGDNTYNPSEFHVYVSADATKWVPLTYTFANGYKNGRWDVATSSFTLPEGTTTLNLYFKSDLGGAHRIDDLKLVVSETAGTAIDFTTGQEFEMGGGGNDNAGDSELDATAIYHNNYDAKTAVKDGNYWPYLADCEDSWQGAVGTGASTVTYAYSEKNLTLRNNSNSDGNYSDYKGSGLNNIFFGKVPAWFATNNITLGGATNLTLTFGADKYIQSGDSNFSKNEYHVWLSADGGAKWVEFTDYTFAGTAAGRWNIATANFSVPAGTATISVCMVVETAGSAYRLDDFKLVASETAFTAVDFTNAVAKDFSTTGGGEVTPPSEVADVTVEEFNGKEVSTSVWYRLTGIVGGPINTTYGNFDLSDNTGKVYVYGISNWSSYSSKVKIGGTVTVVGTRGDHNGKIEVLNGYIEAYDPSTETGEGDPDTPVAPSEPGEYDPQGITWTLGTNAFDNTSGQNAQFGVVNGVDVANLLKIGTSSKTGDATLHVPAGTEKIGFYALAWKDKTAQVKFTIDGTELTTIQPASNTGATGNPPYTITVTDNDYFVIDMPSTEAVDIKVETIDPANGRVLFIRLEANPEAEGGEVTPPEGGETPEPGTITSIADVLALGSGATIPTSTTIEGVVISNMALSNLTSKKGMYVQDETAGLQLRFSADHTFAFGDKVRIALGGKTLGAYQGAVQVSVNNTDAELVSTGNSVTPKAISVSDFLDNKYEGQYVSIEGVQVVEADLAKTFVMGGAHTSINMETADGKKFVVFSSKYATYGADTVPQGSGTIKGISSINSGKMQIIFAQSSDYTGLTGERFEVTPPEGGDQGGETPDPSGPVVATVAEFLAAAEGDTIYQLTGVITSVTNTTYGNFYLKDETAEVLIYGLCSPTGEQKYWAASGAKVGDTITVQTVRTSYNGTPQGKNAIFVSLVPGEPAPEPEIPEGGDQGGEDPVTPPSGEGNAYSVSFQDAANRTEYSTEKQVWEQNGVVVTNEKASSTSNVGDYTNPARFYKSSSLTIAKEGMTQIVFYCNDYKSEYPTSLQSSIGSEYTVKVDGTTVTVTLPSAANEFKIEVLAGQVRVNSLTVYAK